MGIPDKAEQEKPVKKLKLMNAEIDHAYVARSIFRHRANPRAGTSFTDLLDPLYWDNVKDRFRVSYIDGHEQFKNKGQIVEIYPEDELYYAEVLVKQLPDGNISIKKISFVSLEQDNIRVGTDDFKIDFKGNKKNCIVRKIDGEIIQDNFNTPHDAQKALEKYLKEIRG